jgi:hypothetical protein
VNVSGAIHTKGNNMNRVLFLAPAFLAVALSMPAKAETDWSTVDTILTRKAAVSGDVHRYGLPRSDLNVSVDGVTLKPGFALGGWVAFEPMGDKAMMMGDLVLTESEINPVMRKLLAEGLQVTALHNHLLRANPPTFYMHIAGAGDPAQLAQLVRTGLEESSGGKAAITGDFVAVSSELNPLITALRDNGIEVTAVHNHMVGEEPRVFFVHFWANDDAVKLANGLGAALKTVNVARS